MAILDRIRRLFKSEMVQPATTIQEMPKSKNLSSTTAATFTVESDRMAVVKKCREMYSADPRAKAMHRKLARDLMHGGFTVQVEEGEKEGARRAPLPGEGQRQRAQEEAEALVERLKLTKKLDDWIRLTARDGDTFLELGVDAELNISLVTRKPTLQMVRNSNEFDLFDNPEKAFYYIEDEIYLGQGPTRETTWFAEWQIVQARWEHDEGKKYGTPMMASAQGHYKKVQEGELDIAVRRKTRSGMKFLHVVEGADEAGLEAYREYNQDALDNPFAAVSDYFTNRAGSIQTIQGDAHLQEIADVEHMIATWFMGGEVPMELMGYGENLNRDVLGEKRASYDQTIETLREWVAEELISPILERQWLLKGILPEGLKYEITWTATQVVTPAMVRDAADAAARLKLLGVSDESIAAILAKFLPGIELVPGNSAEDGGSGSGEAGEAARMAAVMDAVS